MPTPDIQKIGDIGGGKKNIFLRENSVDKVAILRLGLASMKPLFSYILRPLK